MKDIIIPLEQLFITHYNFIKQIFNTTIYTIRRTKTLEQYSQRLKKQIIPSLLSNIQKIFTGSSCVV